MKNLALLAFFDVWKCFFGKVVLLRFKEFHELHDDLTDDLRKIYPSKKTASFAIPSASWLANFVFRITTPPGSRKSRALAPRIDSELRRIRTIWLWSDFSGLFWNLYSAVTPLISCSCFLKFRCSWEFRTPSKIISVSSLVIELRMAYLNEKEKSGSSQNFENVKILKIPILTINWNC